MLDEELQVNEGEQSDQDVKVLLNESSKNSISKENQGEVEEDQLKAETELVKTASSDDKLNYTEIDNGSIRDETCQRIDKKDPKLTSCPSNRLSIQSEEEIATPPIDESIRLMDWEEFEDWMIKIQEKGLNNFLENYVDKKLLNVEKLLVNLDLTISMIKEEEEDDDDEKGGDQRDEELARMEQQQRLRSFVLIKRSVIKWLKTRKKLTQFNTLEDLVELIKTRSRIMILTGAGISTSCGIPDFRSSDGLYSQLSKEYEDELDDACQMFDLRFFKSKPQIFYSFAKQIFPFSASFLKRETDQKHQSETASEGCYPKSIEPSDSHRFLKLLEFKSKLLRNYTQNIDTLEMKAGVKNLIQCHGSFASFKCLRCDQRFESSEDFERSIYRSEVIVCPICREDLRSEDVPAKKKRKRKRSLDFEGSDSESSDESIDWVSRGLVKPEIIFFGEGLPRTFDEAFETDRYKADLVIVMGTSLAVSPVSDILDYVAEDVPQILINRDPIRGVNFDICCLGDSDLIVRELCKRLGDGWRLDDMRRFQVSGDGQNDELKEQRCGKRHGGSDEEKEVNGSKEEPKRVGESHVWLFRGADTNHPWLRRWMEQENTEASGSR